MNYSKITVDFENLPEWVTFLRNDLNLKGVGVGLIHLQPGIGYRFLHQHKEQEEVYIILEGQGIIHIDGEDVTVSKGDIIKIDPEGKRALKADDESDLVAICIGGVLKKGYPQNPDSKSSIDDGIPDYDNPPHWYANDEDVIKYLRNLKNKRTTRTKK